MGFIPCLRLQITGPRTRTSCRRNPPLRPQKCGVIVPGLDPPLGPSANHALHVIAGLDAAHGGPSYSVPRLCEALAAAGVGTTLLSVAGADDGRRDACARGYSDHRFAWDYAHVPIIRGLRSSSGLAEALDHAA